MAETLIWIAIAVQSVAVACLVVALVLA
jgi:hypothetical protein